MARPLLHIEGDLIPELMKKAPDGDRKEPSKGPSGADLRASDDEHVQSSKRPQEAPRAASRGAADGDHKELSKPRRKRYTAQERADKQDERVEALRKELEAAEEKSERLKEAANAEARRQRNRTHHQASGEWERIVNDVLVRPGCRTNEFKVRWDAETAKECARLWLAAHGKVEG